ncbi:MAG TPA: hypothetical protein VHG91_14070 [Longimicrobium sp.]|nr:hypothetical protein [Longimicrobium sp.]
MRRSIPSTIVLTLAIIAGVAACETLNEQVVMSDPRYVPVEAPEPDPSYRIPPEERERLRPEFDAAALERLLARINPEHRPSVLAGFQLPKPGKRTHMEVWYFGDPELQSLLEEVWEPFWDTVPLELLKVDDSERPGRARAQARRIGREQKPNP